MLTIYACRLWWCVCCFDTRVPQLGAEITRSKKAVQYVMEFTNGSLLPRCSMSFVFGNVVKDVFQFCARGMKRKIAVSLYAEKHSQVTSWRWEGSTPLRTWCTAKSGISCDMQFSQGDSSQLMSEWTFLVERKRGEGVVEVFERPPHILILVAFSSGQFGSREWKISTVEMSDGHSLCMIPSLCW